MVSHCVDGQIPASKVILNFGRKVQAVGVTVVAAPAFHPIGGDLIYLAIPNHADRSMLYPCQQQRAVAENLLHPLRGGAGGHIPVGGCFSHQAVPHTTADHPALLSGSLQRIQQRERLFGNEKTTVHHLQSSGIPAGSHPGRKRRRSRPETLDGGLAFPVL